MLQSFCSVCVNAEVTNDPLRLMVDEKEDIIEKTITVFVCKVCTALLPQFSNVCKTQLNTFVIVSSLLVLWVCERYSLTNTSYDVQSKPFPFFYVQHVFTSH